MRGEADNSCATKKIAVTTYISYPEKQTTAMQQTIQPLCDKAADSRAAKKTAAMP